jgi:hypothetical protein
MHKQHENETSNRKSGVGAFIYDTRLKIRKESIKKADSML